VEFPGCKGEGTIVNEDSTKKLGVLLVETMAPFMEAIQERKIELRAMDVKGYNLM
jgi:hypothetical protein